MLQILSCGCEVKLKRDKLRCSKCGELFCPKHIYQRVDESNRAITIHAPLLCANCANPVPEWEDAQAAVKANNSSPLDVFVFHNEPAGRKDIEFRQQLSDLVAHLTQRGADLLKAEQILPADENQSEGESPA